ncbi:hypothetical protein N7494_009893 [Penicillium frequentans]|uniref:2EXR domain-containing protein n=1 Tax=Penicillium frequentans TaxID=3151616 RepID=A0AAD6CTA5_9EURO|nr:hypothetical protein N7494_009893 [Penicillium glabrum]
MTNDPQFHLFDQLPTELRLAVWRECLSHRVVELDYAWDEGAYLVILPTPCELRKTTKINRRPPIISWVCRESRLIAFEASHCLDMDSEPHLNTRWSSDLRLKKLRINPSRDAIHLNWTPCYEPSYQYSGSALDCLAWNAASLKGRGSLMFDYLDNAFDGEAPIEDRIEALQRLKNGAVVMRIIVVHTTFEKAMKSGLFGLLGDAPIQLVDISDEVRIGALMDFAERCESEIKGSIIKKQDFHRDSVESVKTILKGKLSKHFLPKEPRHYLTYIPP